MKVTLGFLALIRPVVTVHVPSVVVVHAAVPEYPPLQVPLTVAPLTALSRSTTVMSRLAGPNRFLNRSGGKGLSGQLSGFSSSSSYSDVATPHSSNSTASSVADS